MNVYRNSFGELLCSEPDSHSTVADLIDAVLDFCHSNVDCTACTQTCCAGLTVYTDHVFLTALLRLSDQTLSKQDMSDLPTQIMSFDKAAGWWFLPQNGDGRCKFLSRNNKCMIYEARPLVCRLHVCGKIEPKFKQLKCSIYFAYQDALRWEMMQRLQPEHSFAEAVRMNANPVVGTVAYDIPIASILSWRQTVN